MGRVARYKKVKACDPFSRQNNGRQMETVWGEGDNGQKRKKRSSVSTALRKKRRRKEAGDEEFFNTAPSGKDDFDLADLVGSLKKERPVNDLLKDDRAAMTGIVGSAAPTKMKVPESSKSVSDALEAETRDAKILNITTDESSSSSKNQVIKRMEGESKKAFARRMKQETRQLIRNERVGSHNPEKKRRKKEFLNNKKKRKKGVNNRQYEQDDEDDYNLATTANSKHDTFITGEQAAARMASAPSMTFGEQVERPPEFKLLPRGATAKAAATNKSKKTKHMDSIQEEAEKRSMEIMRRKVQAQYAVMKAKRREAGDFHL